jgi:hypothetical protein
MPHVGGRDGVLDNGAERDWAHLDEIHGHASRSVALLHEAFEVDVQELEHEVKLLLGMDDVKESGSHRLGELGAA